MRTFILFCLLGSITPLLGQITTGITIATDFNRTDFDATVRSALVKDNGNFYVLADRKLPAPGYYDIILFDFNPFPPYLMDSTVLDLNKNLEGISMILAENGHTWIAARHLHSTGEDHSDILLLELNADKEIINDYTYDRYRYEDGFAMIQSAPQSISILTQGNNEDYVYENFTERMLTVSMQDGSVISDIELPNLELDPEYSDQVPLVKGQDGEIAMLKASLESPKLLLLNTNNGTIDAFHESFNYTNCNGVESFGPHSSTLLYDEAESVYLSIDDCLQIWKISQDGSISVQSSENPYITENTERGVYLRKYQGGYRAHQAWNRYQIQELDDSYTVSDSLTVGVFSGRLRGKFRYDWCPTYGLNALPQNFSLYYDQATSTFPASAMEAYREGWVIDEKNRISVGNEEIVMVNNTHVNGFAELRAQSDLFFFDRAGNLLDSLRINDLGPKAYCSDVVALPDSKYLLTITNNRLNFNPESDSLLMVYYDRLSTTIDTIRVIENGVLFFDALVDTKRGPDGNFYTKYVDINNWTPAIGYPSYYTAYTPEGAVLYDTFNDSLFVPVNGIFAVDADSNLHLIRRNAPNEDLLYQRLDISGQVVESISLDLDISSRYGIGCELNQSGNRLLIYGSQASGEEEVALVFAELDLLTNTIIREEIIASGVLPTRRLEAAYEPNSNRVITLHSIYTPGAVAADARRSLLFSVFDEEGLTYQEVAVASYGTILPTDLHSPDFGDVYAVGSQFFPELRKQATTLINIQYEAIVSIDEAIYADPANRLTVFPNPAAEQVRVEWNNTAVNSQYELQLLSTDGRPIRRWLGELPVGRANLDVDLSRLPAGTYLVRLQTEAGVTTQRIVKQ